MNLFLLIAKGMDRDIPDPNPFIEIAEALGVQEVTPLKSLIDFKKVGFHKAPTLVTSTWASCLDESSIA